MVVFTLILTLWATPNYAVTWWNSDYTNASRIDILNNWRDINDSYTLRLSFNNTDVNIVNPNMTSIRFLNADNSTHLEYLFINKTINGTSTVDVRICCEAKHGGDWLNNTNRTIYMYWGNPNATNNESFEGTYWFADPVDDLTINDNIHAIGKTGVNDGRYEINSTASWNTDYLKTHANYTNQSGLTYEGTLETVSGSQYTMFGFGSTNLAEGVGNQVVSNFFLSPGEAGIASCWGGTCATKITTFWHHTGDVDVRVKGVITTSILNYYIMNVTTKNGTWHNPLNETGAFPLSSMKLFLDSGTAGQKRFLDNIKIYVRRIPELNHSWGVTQSNVTPPPAPPVIFYRVDYTSPTPDDGVTVGFDYNTVINLSAVINATGITSFILEWNGKNITKSDMGNYSDFSGNDLNTTPGTLNTYTGIVSTTEGDNRTATRTLIVSTFTIEEITNRFGLDDLMLLLLLLVVGILCYGLFFR